MTVAELIEKLKQLPPDQDVLKSTWDGMFRASTVESVFCYQDKDNEDHISEDMMPEYPDDDPDKIRKEFAVIR
jgi:hypothetical protein